MPSDAATDWIISEYVVGTAGLLERLGLGVRLILGIKPRRRIRRPLGSTRPVGSRSAAAHVFGGGPATRVNGM